MLLWLLRPAPVADRRADKLTHKQKEEQQQGRRGDGPGRRN